MFIVHRRESREIKVLRKCLLFAVVMTMPPGGLVSCQSRTARDLDRVTEILATREILKSHLGKGSREIDIQIFASVSDLSLNERLALGWSRSLVADALLKKILELENQKFFTASLIC